MSGDAPVEERSEWNRRLGMLALSGAAAVSSLVLALALGGGRVPVSVIRGGGQVPVGVPGIVQSGQSILGPFGSGTLGGGGYDPTVTGRRALGTRPGGNAVGEDPGLGGVLASPGRIRRPDEPAPIVNPGRMIGTGGGGDGGGGGTVAAAAVAAAVAATVAAVAATAAAHKRRAARAASTRTRLDRAESTTRTADLRVIRERRRLTGRVSVWGLPRNTARTEHPHKH